MKKSIYSDTITLFTRSLDMQNVLARKTRRCCVRKIYPCLPIAIKLASDIVFIKRTAGWLDCMVSSLIAQVVMIDDEKLTREEIGFNWTNHRVSCGKKELYVIAGYVIFVR